MTEWNKSKKGPTGRESRRERNFFKACGSGGKRNLKIFAWIAFLVTGAVVAAEIVLRLVLGMGDPVLYDSSPIYGYRLLPNQNKTRFLGSKIKTNNLGLRCDFDWDNTQDKKVLFIGDSVAYGGSYVDNKELFSHLAVEKFAEYMGGNCGVNAWGIENMHGLLVEKGFTPAEIYVIVVPEGDFYRGLTRMLGLPYFNKRPRFALQELALFCFYRLNLSRYSDWRNFASDSDIEAVVEKAVVKLKGINVFLEERGLKSRIFITPAKDQVLSDKPKDHVVQEMLNKHGVDVIYIADRLADMDIKKEPKIFYDKVHLTKQGHKIWAKIIQGELGKIINER